MSESDFENTRPVADKMPELPSLRTFVVRRWSLVESGQPVPEEISVVAHNFAYSDGGALFFQIGEVEYVEDRFRLVLRIKRAFNVGAWEEMEETTPPPSLKPALYH